MRRRYIRLAAKILATVVLATTSNVSNAGGHGAGTMGKFQGTLVETDLEYVGAIFASFIVLTVA